MKNNKQNQVKYKNIENDLGARFGPVAQKLLVLSITRNRLKNKLLKSEKRFVKKRTKTQELATFCLRISNL
jgi:hypothetical protein